MINKFVGLQISYVFINIMKYRTLSNPELEEFEKEFISFLVINGIEAKDWQKIKESDKEKTKIIIEQFSDVIFENILRKNMFLEFISSQSIKCFQCLKDEIVLVGIDAKSNSKINFLGEQSMDSIIINQAKHIEVYHSKKKYTKLREEEMFSLLSSGAKLSKGKLFKQISLLL
ncbi:MAG: DUF6495 family protein [Crocinitomicaceae bacterium]